MEILQAKGAKVSYHDPFVDHVAVGGLKLKGVVLDEKCLKSADCLVITTHHSDYEWIVQNAHCIVDTRNATKGVSGTEGKVFKL